MVNVLVMSRKEAERYSHSPHDEESAVISISTPDEHYDMNIYSSIYNGIKRILRLSFDDVDNGSFAMTEGDAASIAEFVEENKDKTIIVHCDAGISRSAGIAAAIMKHYNGDDTPIFNSRLYCPNMLCYRMVLEKLEGGRICYA